MNRTKVNIGGINEIKYPERNNQESFADCIHFDTNMMIKRGNARRTKTIGPVKTCLYCRYSIRKCS
jgi:hypothetical protein